MPSVKVRCAIYTRKSSEEGLEQSFNSLEAQREACRSFILSQKHEGWIALTAHYDDGGFSGGTMERPALQQLLTDIRDGKIDTVVVYKVDRLTRSLADFGKIIELFEAKKVSFVSVTQQFNTTTSMGRLTLNVLLSFAQFEREITGERIRDKVAASKKKGMWMGGMVPLGYDCVDRKLVVNRAEADAVRDIFSNYLKLGCVTKLKSILEERQIRTKVRTSGGGRAFSRGALYHLLRNRLYLGDIVHRGVCYPGRQEAIVSPRLWQKVQTQLARNDRARRTGRSVSSPGMLTGLLFDTNGVRFTPTHSLKNGKRYRYYTSQATIQNTDVKPSIARFPADQIENIVLTQIRGLLTNPREWKCRTGPSLTLSGAIERSKQFAQVWPTLPEQRKYEIARKLVQRVVIGGGRIWTEVDRTNLFKALLGDVDKIPSSMKRPITIRLVSEVEILHRGQEVKIIAPKQKDHRQTRPVSSLLNAVARARSWYERITSGEATLIGQVAKQAGLQARHTRRILRCGLLSPEIVAKLLSGEHQPNLTLNRILNKRIPIDWADQKRQILGARAT